jgi:predicted XRE-type DNA-binding protein
MYIRLGAIPVSAIVFDNVFEGIARGKDAAKEAADLTFRADMMLLVRSMLEEKNLTQKEIGELLGVPQSRVSELMCGKLQKLSADVLLGYLFALGYRIQPTFTKPVGRKRGAVKVVVIRHAVGA